MSREYKRQNFSECGKKSSILKKEQEIEKLKQNRRKKGGKANS